MINQVWIDKVEVSELDQILYIFKKNNISSFIYKLPEAVERSQDIWAFNQSAKTKCTAVIRELRRCWCNIGWLHQDNEIHLKKQERNGKRLCYGCVMQCVFMCLCFQAWMALCVCVSAFQTCGRGRQNTLHPITHAGECCSGNWK